MWAKRTACLSRLMKTVPGKQTAASSTKSLRPLTSWVCWQCERCVMRRASQASWLSSPAIRVAMPDASLEVFSISCDSINVMFFHELNQSSALLHAFTTCLYWAWRMGRLCFSDQSLHVCKALAAIGLSKPLGYFCPTDHTFSIPFLHFKETALFLQTQTTGMWSTAACWQWLGCC